MDSFLYPITREQALQGFTICIRKSIGMFYLPQPTPMTKQLPQEIQEAIKELIAEMDFIKFHSDTRYANWDELKKTMRNNIIVHLQPYLSLPQQEEPKQIDWLLYELSVTGSHPKLVRDTDATIQLLLDTVNSLLSKQV